MRHAIIIIVALSAIPAGTTAAWAKCRCQVNCPRCQHTCDLNVDTEKYTKECFTTECKPVCIPQVTLPWQKCCEPKCARVRYVNVLKTKEYECERCRYTWTPRELPTCHCASQAAAAEPAVGVRPKAAPRQFRLTDEPPTQPVPVARTSATIPAAPRASKPPLTMVEFMRRMLPTNTDRSR